MGPLLGGHPTLHVTKQILCDIQTWLSSGIFPTGKSANSRGPIPIALMPARHDHFIHRTHPLWPDFGRKYFRRIGIAASCSSSGIA